MPPKNQNHAFNWLDFTRDIIFYKPDFAIEDEQELKERKSRELAETFAKNWLYEKPTLPEKNEPGEKTWTKLIEPLLKKCSRFWKLDLDQKKHKPEEADFAKWNRLFAKTLTENLEVDFSDLSKFETKLFEQKTWADFEANNFWK